MINPLKIVLTGLIALTAALAVSCLIAACIYGARVNKGHARQERQVWLCVSIMITSFALCFSLIQWEAMLK